MTATAHTKRATFPLHQQGERPFLIYNATISIGNPFTTFQSIFISIDFLLSHIVTSRPFCDIFCFFRRRIGTLCTFAHEYPINMSHATPARIKNSPCLILSSVFRPCGILLALVVLHSCGLKVPRDPTLDEVEAVINARPDSALGMLVNMDTIALDGTGRARYVYLKTRACDKLHISITWPEEMQSAADVLDSVMRGQNDTLALVHYYAGIAHEDNRRFYEAVISFLKSLDYQNPAPSRIKRFTYQNLYSCYWKQNLKKEAKNAILHTLDIATKLKDDPSVCEMLAQTAMVYGFLQEKDSALLFARKSVAKATVIKDSTALSMALRTMSVIYRTCEEYDSARYYQDKAFDTHPRGEKIDSHWLFSKAVFFANTDNRDSALSLFAELLPDADLQMKHDIYQQWYDLEKRTGHQQEASSCSDSLIYYRNELDKCNQGQEILNRIAEHRHTESQKTLQTRLYKKGGIIGLLLVLLALVALLFLRHNRRHLKEKRQEVTALREKMVDLQKQMEVLQKQKGQSGNANEEEQDVTEEKILALQGEQIRLCFRIFRLRPEHKRIEAVSLESTPALNTIERASIADAIVYEFSAVLGWLRADYPQLTVEDVFYCLLSRIGYNTKVCAALMGKSMPTLREQKSRIKKKVSPAFFLFFFNK